MIENKILLDSSFIVRLIGVFPKHQQHECFKMISGQEIIAPSLTNYEVGNILLKYPKLNFQNFWKTYCELPLHLIFSHNYLEIGKIAIQYKLTFYDASYCEILKNNQQISKFYTFDRDFLKYPDERIEVLSEKNL